MKVAKPRVLMVSSECSPWAKSGGLADVLGALPKALAREGHAVGVVIPRYQKAWQAPATRMMDSLRIPLGGGFYDVAVWEMQSDGVTLYFVDHHGLYGRNGLYGDSAGEFGDNHIRFGVLCRAALEISRHRFSADIFHCHDWQAGLLPLYLRDHLGMDPSFLHAKSIMTIHNLGYQGVFPRSKMPELSLPDWLYREDLVEFHKAISLLKAGIVYADAVTTVSRRYAQEIQTPDYGFRLDGLLRARNNVLTGILNGVDYTVWNPETDRHLPSRYSADDLTGKRECKRALLTEMGLPERLMDRPLCGIVSRFAGQKGFDIFGQVAWQFLQEQDAGLVVLGDGEKWIEDIFRHLHHTFRDRVAIWIGYNDGLAHRIEAGSDIFIMPSRYEPCGLNQIYSLRYGTVPVVRATGGLDDTVDESTGFKFHDYNGHALLDALRAACGRWHDREAWEAMVRRGMQKDFSWSASAKEYSELYRRLQPLAG